MSEQKKARQSSEWKKKAGLFIVSVLISLLLGEGICRIFFSPIDILSPELVPDPVLGHHIQPGSGGHDAWGFRNATVPDEVDVAVIGDSQTWGVNAASTETFPSQLGQLSGKSVYNFGISGYGPIQYQYLVKNMVWKLHPKKIVVAFYLGNDFNEAFRMAYQYDHWSNFRSAEFDSLSSKHESQPFTIEQGYFFEVRYWLNRNSIFYRLVKDKMDFMMSSIKDNDSNFVHYENKDRNIDKYFNPYSRLSVMNANDPSTREGLRISLECLKIIADVCSSNETDLRVVLIPTDIMVYSEFLYHNNLLKGFGEFDAIIESERKLKDSLIAGMDRQNIHYIDVLGALKEHSSQVIYPKLEEGHPSPLGYQIIAEAIISDDGNRSQPR